MATVSDNYTAGSDAPEDSTSADDVVQQAIAEDPELRMIAERLDTHATIDPDRDLKIEISGETSDGDVKDSDSISTGTDGSLRDVDAAIEGSPEKTKFNKDELQSDKSVDKNNGSANGSGVQSRQSSLKSSPSVRSKTSISSKSSSSGEAGDKTKNPLKLLKKLTKFDKPAVKKSDFYSEFSAVVVDRLPQVFVVKYLGHQKVSGVCGLHHVRRPVDEMVRQVKDKLDHNSEVELPLLYVVVSPKGLDLREHQQNKTEAGSTPLGLLPIDFISYGVQDIKYWRVFTCIVVRELSARTRTATCHAFLTDSSHNGRKMALALGAAFNVYSSRLKSAGKAHNFQVELRPPDQLADAIDEECEA